MNMLQTLLLVLHLLVAVGICGFVLLQHGKGADMGAAFGSGSSGTIFGAAGSANFLSRTTAVLAAVFFATSLGLTWFASTQGAGTGRDAAGHRREDGAEGRRGPACGRRAARGRAREGRPGERTRRDRSRAKCRSDRSRHADVVKLVDTLS